MTVLRVRKKTTNFLVLDKTCLAQPNLSWGAKGLHAYLMGLPEDWRVNVKDLQKRATNGRDSVRSLLSELEKTGYIVKEQIRNERTGKFGPVEYVVHELPELVNSDSPLTENPLTDLPAPDSPETGNPTLININSNKYTNNKILKAAAEQEDEELSLEDDLRESAAAYFEEKTQLPQNKSLNVNFTNQASREDSVIGKELTPYQHERLDHLVKTVFAKGFDVPSVEIEHCLLNSNYFKGCGHDFGRKLNAIRTVILRSEWQTPALLVLNEAMKAKENDNVHHMALKAVNAEINHFQRLLESSKASGRENLQGILNDLFKKQDELVLAYDNEKKSSL